MCGFLERALERSFRSLSASSENEVINDAIISCEAFPPLSSDCTILEAKIIIDLMKILFSTFVVAPKISRRGDETIKINTDGCCCSGFGNQDRG